MACFFGVAAYLPAWHLASAMQKYGDAAVTTGRLASAYMVGTNTLAFALTAMVIRRRWFHLTLSQVFTAAMLLGLLTFSLLWLTALFVRPYLDRLPSAVAWVFLLLPGAVAAQLLRFSRKPQLKP